MRRNSSPCCFLLCWLRNPSFADEEHAGHEHAGQEVVGAVTFANSCSPAVQQDLGRGIAMLHSFWYSAGEQTFRAVLAKDPGCAIADWGIASLMMNNPLAGVGSTPAEAGHGPGGARRGARASAPGRSGSATTSRPSAPTTRISRTRPERERQVSRSAAYEALAAKYPDDDEAQIFDALYIAGTQSQADQTYAAYGRAARSCEGSSPNTRTIRASRTT